MNVNADEGIPFLYGSVAILASIFFFQVLNFSIRWPFHGQSRSRAESPLRMLSENWKHRNIVVSWIHAIIVGTWNLISFWYYYDQIMADPIEYHNFCIYSLVSFSTGYFLHDFIDIAMHHAIRARWDIIIHHFVVLITFLINVIQCRFLGLNVIALLAEVNSIFLHLRKLLQLIKLDSIRWLYLTVVSLNLFTVVFFRFLCIGLFTYELFSYYDQFSLPHMSLLVLSTVIMLYINAVLFWRLISIDLLRPVFGQAHCSEYLSCTKDGRKLESGSTTDNNNAKLNGVVSHTREHED